MYVLVLALDFASDTIPFIHKHTRLIRIGAHNIALNIYPVQTMEMEFYPSGLDNDILVHGHHTTQFLLGN